MPIFPLTFVAFPKIENFNGFIFWNDLYMDDLKASATSIEAAQAVHETVKKFAAAVEMVINAKKSAIQLNTET